MVEDQGTASLAHLALESFGIEAIKSINRCRVSLSFPAFYSGEYNCQDVPAERAQLHTVDRGGVPRGRQASHHREEAGGLPRLQLGTTARRTCRNRQDASSLRECRCHWRPVLFQAGRFTQY